MSATGGVRPLVAYARWQVLDYLRSGGLTGILIGLLLGIPLYMTRDAAVALGLADGFRREVISVTGTLGFLLVLLAVQRMSAGDRAAGTYRFYFSKAVRVPAFYAQKYLVVGAGVLLVAIALWVIAAVADVRVPAGALLAYFAVLYVALGGVVFLSSALTRRDWVLAVGLWVAAQLLRGISGARGWPLWPLRVLPPVEALGAIQTALFAGIAPAAADFAWAIGYGLAALLLGLVILARRPLAS